MAKQFIQGVRSTIHYFLSPSFTSVHEWCTGEKGSNASMALCEALLTIENFHWPSALYEEKMSVREREEREKKRGEKRKREREK